MAEDQGDRGPKSRSARAKMDWFRFHHNAVFDPKVQRLPGETYKFWHNLLCLASMNEDRGILPPVEDIAFILKLTAKKAQDLINDLVSRTLLDRGPDGYRPHNWEWWQFQETPAAVRQRRYRERRRDGKRDRDVTTANGAALSDDDAGITRDVSVARRVTRDVDTCENRNVTRCATRSTPIVTTVARQVMGDSDSDTEYKIQASQFAPGRGGAPAEAPAREPFDPTDGEDEENGAEWADPERDPGYLKALEVVRSSLGEAAAAKLAYEFDTVGSSLRGRWDCLAAAAVEVRQEIDTPGGEPIRRPFGLMLTKARDYSLKPGPPPPLVATPVRKPKDPTPGYAIPLQFTDRERARVANAKPPAHRPAPPKTGMGA